MSQSNTLVKGFFSAGLSEADPVIAKWIGEELGRQSHQIELIASETSSRAQCWKHRVRC